MYNLNAFQLKRGAVLVGKQSKISRPEFCRFESAANFSLENKVKLERVKNTLSFFNLEISSRGQLKTRVFFVIETFPLPPQLPLTDTNCFLLNF